MSLRDKLPLQKLAKELSKKDHIGYSTLLDHINKGIKRRSDGVIIYFKPCQLPSGMVASVDDYEAFLEELNQEGKL